MEFLRAVDPTVIENIGAYILLAFVILFIFLERWIPYSKDVKLFRKGFWMDLVWYTIIQSFILKILIFDFIIAPIKVGLGWGEVGFLSHLPIWLLCLFFLITHDFYIYWFHRLQHHHVILWRTHEAHHSVRNVDWLAGSRSHATEILINQTIEFLPIFLLLDVKTAAIIVPLKALIDAIWGMWIHANIDVKTGKLQYFINGPEMHQWHHANHKEVFYANYATKFAFFDWIFGTAFLPGLQPIKWPILKPISFGLPYAYPQDYFSQFIFALRRFDFSKLEQMRWYQSINLLRAKPVCWLSPKSKSEHIFDLNNTSYNMDKEVKQCSNCGRKMKFYYDASKLVWICNHGVEGAEPERHKSEST